MAAPPPIMTPAPVDVPAITTTVSAAMLARAPACCMDIFMKNKGGSDEVKLLKEQKQWNAWQCNFLSIAHVYDFKDITNIAYTPGPMDTNACTVFELQKKHVFGILIPAIKESSALPVVCKYSDLNATDYGDAQLLYDDLVLHYTNGLSGSQCLKIIEHEINDLKLDTKWGRPVSHSLVWLTTA